MKVIVQVSVVLRRTVGVVGSDGLNTLHEDCHPLRGSKRQSLPPTLSPMDELT